MCVFMPKYVFCSEFVIRCRSWVVCSELAFVAKLCILQRICDSLPKLSCLQWISIRCRIVCFYSESVIRCRSCIVCSEFVTRFWNWVVCSEVAFAVEIVAPAANQFSLPISTIGLPGIDDLNASNNFMVWWCKMWNTCMWTYELLKKVWWWMW
jgi:hypothetical protein